ncbi:MAG: COX15/CtaA family protein, partial [Pseudomonadota bacterium]
QTRWWPPMDFADAFVLWRGLGVDYEGGVLSNPARVAIHVSHRIGAIVTVLALLGVVLAAWRSRHAVAWTGTLSRVLLGVLALQVSLGISNVIFNLPLLVATAHNGVAALLVILLLAFVHPGPYGRVKLPT